MERLATPDFPLFVPADRPDRFAKACLSGADGVIIDLEDAVAPDARIAARHIPDGSLPDAHGAVLCLRINGVGTPWHQDDVAFAKMRRFGGVMLPKVESAAQVEALRAALPPATAVIGLIETVAGLAVAEGIAGVADRIAFGSVDFAEDMGCAHQRDVLLPIRSRLVQAARLAGGPPPLDGVTVSISDLQITTDDAVHAREMGFGGKLLIHPAQIDPARAAFRPSAEDIAWANRVLAASSDGAATTIDGAMVDAPVLARARRIAARAEALE